MKQNVSVIVGQQVIADGIMDAILDNLKDRSFQISGDNARLVWLDFVKHNLNEGLQKSIDNLMDKLEVQ